MRVDDTGKGKSPYAKYRKRPTDYGSTYSRAPHLKMRPAQYAPSVNNPFYNKPKSDYSDTTEEE